MEFQNKNPKIYVLTGKAGNGKNKFASYIGFVYSKRNKRTINLAYASYLKDYAKNIVNWDGKEETKPREFLQEVGIDLIKNKISPNMLINRVIEDIKIYSYFYDVITISDARFVEEIEMIRKNFNNVIVVHIYGLENSNGLTEKQRKHITEVSLDKYNNYDYEVKNNGVLEELINDVQTIVDEVETNG
jgi:hypothetical protein